MMRILLYLYVFSFLGWIYESTYESIRNRELLNRGFMHGPFIPIYGIGWLICVQISSYAPGSQLKTFIYAVVICTVMELLTGILMEKLFNVRYWDYSYIPFNIKGYICIPASLLWGFIALFIKNYAYIYTLNEINSMNSEYLETVVYIITVIFAADLAISVAEAASLRNLLDNIKFRISELPEKKEMISDIRESLNTKHTVVHTKLNSKGKDIYYIFLNRPTISSKHHRKILSTIKDKVFK